MASGWLPSSHGSEPFLPLFVSGPYVAVLSHPVLDRLGSLANVRSFLVGRKLIENQSDNLLGIFGGLTEQSITFLPRHVAGRQDTTDDGGICWRKLDHRLIL